jgi:Na+/proline symporter
MLGSGVIFGPASYVLSGGGVIGMICYSLFAGIPLVVVASLGKIIKSRMQKPMSIASFANVRFGKLMNLYISTNVLINLGIALSVEYTVIGALFKQYLDIPGWIPILTVGVTTMVYTIVGGIYVSILTDQIQSIVTITLIFCVAVYISCTFKLSLPQLPSELSTDSSMGWSSIPTLGIALTSSAIFSDSVWQRVWAAKDDDSLWTGSIIGMTMAIFITLFFSGSGFLAGWAGLVDFNNEDSINTAFFAILKPSSDAEIPALMLGIVCMIASILNESAVDSFQNAILDTIVSFFLSLGYPVSLEFARLSVVLFNVPIMIIGIQGLPIIKLYLMTNLLTSASCLPLCVGLLPCFDQYVTGFKN